MSRKWSGLIVVLLISVSSLSARHHLTDLPTPGRARPIAARRSFLRADAKRSATSQDECLLAQRGAAPVLGGLSVWVRGPV